MFIKKNVIILHPADKSACAFYRCDAMAALLRSSRSGEVEVIVSRAEITDDYILKYTAAIVIFRPTTENQETFIQHYKRKRNRFGFKIFADFDDLVFDLDGKQTIPTYNSSRIDVKPVGAIMERCLGDIDGVTVTTEWLKRCMEYRFGWKHVKLLPNAVPRFFFGYTERHLVGGDLEKPRVLYAGSTSHFKEGDDGDFAGPWLPWLKDAVANDRIELHLFNVPDCLQEYKDSIKVHRNVSAIEFPATIANIKPNFYLAPLQDNVFNRAKSNLKLLEATAIGAVLLGSSFNFGPYEEAHPLSKITKNCTFGILRERFDILCQKESWNEVMEYQEKLMEYNGYWLDSHYYVARWLRAYFGELLQVNI